MNTICKFMTGREAEFIDFVVRGLVGYIHFFYVFDLGVIFIMVLLSQSQGTMSAGVEERAAMHKKTIDKWILEVVV